MKNEYAEANNSFGQFVKGEHYKIRSETKTCYYVLDYETNQEVKCLKKDITFNKLPLRSIRGAELKKFLTGEITYEELSGSKLPNNGYNVIGNLTFKIEDLYKTVIAWLKKGAADFRIVSSQLSYLLDFYDKDFKEWEDKNDEEDLHFLNQSHIVHGYVEVINDLHKSFFSKINNDPETPLNLSITPDDILQYLINMAQELSYLTGVFKTKVTDYQLTSTEKKIIARRFMDYLDIVNMKPEDVVLVNSTLDDLISQDDFDATQTKAYLDYEGTSWWPTNYIEAERLLWKLAEQPDYYAYNTLGYLYTYHSTTMEPNYEMAYKCFALGALGNVTEAKYKIADCLEKGLGIKQNANLASYMISHMYQQEKEKFQTDTSYMGKFGDVAYRKGKYILKGIGLEAKDPSKGKIYLLQAKYALEKRREEGGYIGDSSVIKAIDTALEECPESHKKSPDYYPVEDYDDYTNTIEEFSLGHNYYFIDKISLLNNILTFRLSLKDKREKSLITFTSYGFSTQVNQLTVQATIIPKSLTYDLSKSKIKVNHSFNYLSDEMDVNLPIHDFSFSLDDIEEDAFSFKYINLKILTDKTLK